MCLFNDFGNVKYISYWYKSLKIRFGQIYNNIFYRLQDPIAMEVIRKEPHVCRN